MIPVNHTTTASLLRTVADGNTITESSGNQVQRSSHPYATTSAIKSPSKERKMEKRRHFVTAVLFSWGI